METASRQKAFFDARSSKGKSKIGIGGTTDVLRNIRKSGAFPPNGKNVSLALWRCRPLRQVLLSRLFHKIDRRRAVDKPQNAVF
jgi:hypothetical protein